MANPHYLKEQQKVTITIFGLPQSSQGSAFRTQRGDSLGWHGDSNMDLEESCFPDFIPSLRESTGLKSVGHQIV